MLACIGGHLETNYRGGSRNFRSGQAHPFSCENGAMVNHAVDFIYGDDNISRHELLVKARNQGCKKIVHGPTSRQKKVSVAYEELDLEKNLYKWKKREWSPISVITILQRWGTNLNF